MDYEKNNFDDNIRQALGDREMPLAAGASDRFFEKLDAADLSADETGEESAFDRAVAAKAAAPAVTAAPDWETFSEKLDRAEDADSFDTAVAAGLTAAAAGAAADWSDFAEILDAAESADLSEDGNAIDRSAQQKLEGYEAPYSEENWAIMREKIQEEFSLRRKLTRWKAAEITLMLLAIFTLFNYLPRNEQGNILLIDQVKEEIKKRRAPQNVEQTETESVIIASKSPVSDHTTAQNSVAGVAEKIGNPNDNTVTNYTATGNPVSIYAPQNEQKSLPPLDVLEAKLKTPTDPLSDVEVKVETALQEDKKGFFAWMKKDEKTPVDEETRMKSFVTEAIAAKKAGDLTAAEEEKKLKPSKVDFPHKNVRLGMYSALDMYGVYSPYDRFFNYRPDVTYGSNIGGGLHFDFQKDRFHLVLGAAYAPKYYRPAIGGEVLGSFTSGYLLEELREIQLDILHLPVEFRYDFLQKSKWRIYGATGVSFNFVLNTNYVIAEEFLTENADNDFSEIQTLQRNNSNLQRKTFTEGVTEGGTLIENTYVKLQIGFGAERFITQRWSVFAEPIYHQQFSRMGIGPNDNSFRTLSVRLGAKVTILGK